MYDQPWGIQFNLLCMFRLRLSINLIKSYHMSICDSKAYADGNTLNYFPSLYILGHHCSNRPRRSRGPFLESPGNFSGPKSNIQIKYKE